MSAVAEAITQSGWRPDASDIRDEYEEFAALLEHDHARRRSDSERAAFNCAVEWVRLYYPRLTLYQASARVREITGYQGR